MHLLRDRRSIDSRCEGDSGNESLFISEIRIAENTYIRYITLEALSQRDAH